MSSGGTEYLNSKTNKYTPCIVFTCSSYFKTEHLHCWKGMVEKRYCYLCTHLQKINLAEQKED